MTSTIQKWGNSLAVRIPGTLAKDFHLHKGSQVDILLVEGDIVLRPKTRKKFSLMSLLKGIHKGNIHSEQDWGAPKGKETW